jgi:hypothetical protein
MLREAAHFSAAHVTLFSIEHELGAHAAHVHLELEASDGRTDVDEQASSRQ